MSIDWDKPVQTRDGREVRIYTTEGESKQYPVVGEYLNEHGGWTANSWMINGESPYHRNVELVNAPQQHTWTINVNRRKLNSRLNFCGHDSREEADSQASSQRIACIEVTFAEGDGL